MIEWTERDHRAARVEGWYIYNHPPTIWASGINVQFMHNREAYEFVAQRAEEGSELHEKALAYIAQQGLLP